MNPLSRGILALPFSFFILFLNLFFKSTRTSSILTLFVTPIKKEIMIASRPTSQSSQLCLLAQAPITTPGFLPCGHQFEKRSISLWLANGGSRCPLCREVCCLEEVSASPEEATEKAKQLGHDKLRGNAFADAGKGIRISSDLTFALALEVKVKNSLRQVSTLEHYKNEDGNRIYRLFMTRVFTQFVLNVEPLRAAGIPNKTLKDASESERLRFNLGFKRIFAAHLVAGRSPLLLYALIEDKVLHEAIVPPAYAGLSPCRSAVSSRELAREYMLCEQIQSIERDVGLATTGIEVPHLPSLRSLKSLPLGHLLSMFKKLQEVEQTVSQPAVVDAMKQFYPFWHERILAHFRSGSEDRQDIERELFTSSEGIQAITRAEVEFLLSTILLLSPPNDADHQERSVALEVFDGLAEQIECPTGDVKVAISVRLYQILGDLLPAKRGESSEERGRSLLPLVFHQVHPTAILYAITQLRSELHAYWQFSDPSDYEQEWIALQQKMHL